LLLVALIVTSGCLGAVGAGDGATDAETDAQTADTTTANAAVEESENETPTDEELTRNLDERAANIDSLALTRETTYVIDGNETSTTTRVWARLDSGEQRTEMLAPEENAGNVLLINESMTVRYDADQNVANVLDRSGTDGDYGARTTIVSALRNVSRAEYQATETVNGERTYRVRLVPEESASATGDAEITAWLDTETYFPKRVEVTSSGGDMNYSSVIEYRNVSLDPDIPDSRFVLDPPGDAEWTERTTPETESYDSREALNEAVDLSVPDPDLPDGFEFESATAVNGSSQSVYIAYTNGSATLQFSKVTETYDGTNADGETVSLGDREGQYRETNGYGIVTWTCDGNTYSVSGQLDRERLIDVAASMECE
jgi:outer membrane lipoprotein-sorting protein